MIKIMAIEQNNLTEITKKIMHYLALREHSAYELKQKCLKKGMNAIQLDQVINTLIAKNIISDRRFTENYIHWRYEKGFGIVRIRQELVEKGIATNLIDEFLFEDDEQWQISMIQVLTKKYGNTKKPLSFKEKAKRARFLEYRGFPTGLIRAYLF